MRTVAGADRGEKFEIDYWKIFICSSLRQHDDGNSDDSESSADTKKKHRRPFKIRIKGGSCHVKANWSFMAGGEE